MSDTNAPHVKSTRDTRTAFAKMPAVALADHRLTDAAFRLYAVFIDTVNPDDADPTVWLSRARMAERCGKSKASVKSMDKALDNLIACGYVQLVGGRHGQTSRYALVAVTELDRTYGQSTLGDLWSISPTPVVERPYLPVVNRPHNQEPPTKNPLQQPSYQQPSASENRNSPFGPTYDPWQKGA